ncbi:hypothetical protein ZWY2020_041085 [Hordeum vulgare]|nr:hypothetical protein ZWY2020_041085 [Hordeum vulgare]
MNTFLGFGREHVTWNFENSENPVYLHIVQRRKPEADETGRPPKKPTLLAIGRQPQLIRARSSPRHALLACGTLMPPPVFPQSSLVLFWSTKEH